MNHVEQATRLVAQLVCGMQPLAHLHGDANADRQGNAASLVGGFHEHAERLAIHPLHDQEQNAVLFSEVEDLGDVGVADARGERRLVEKHLLEQRIVADRGQHRLDGDDLLKPSGPLHAGRPDRGHPAAGDRHQELVPAKHVAGTDIAEDFHWFATTTAKFYRSLCSSQRVLGGWCHAMSVRAYAVSSASASAIESASRSNRRGAKAVAMVRSTSSAVSCKSASWAT